MAPGKQEGTLVLKKEIRQFVETYNININEFKPLDIDEYKTFKDFFTRAHRPGSRPIHQPEDASITVVVANSRVVTYKSVAETKSLWIKGNGFSIANLIMDTQIGLRFDSGAVASFCLSPQDYHWYYSPVLGKSKVDILTRNRRKCVVMEIEDFGDMLFVAIGATNIGSGLTTIRIYNWFQKRGKEARVEFDQDLLDLSKQQIQVAVKVGMSLGHASSV
ncbi:phosphatidylserine decarboxylase-domain-containing protein [Diaporthe sp. PMI_573]|nr:phosphatidylserine decarboxylase-domain-containing protein [Diaporthaceae sp. PMI_573]